MKVFKKILLLLLAIGLIVGVFLFIRKINNAPFQLLSPEIIQTEKPISPTLFKFAVSSDIHSDLKNLDMALEMIKKNGDNFLIITGDLTTVGGKKELTEIKKVLDLSGVRYYVIPGNHDNWSGNQAKIDLFQAVFGQRFQSFYQDKKVKFILVDNSSYLGVSEQQEKWLMNQVAECPQIYCLVFMHMPLNHPSSSHIMGEDSAKVTTQAARLTNLLVQNKVKEVFAGHLHYASEYDLGGLHTAIVGSLATDRNTQSPRFLQVDFAGQIKIKEILIPEDEAPSN